MFQALADGLLLHRVDVTYHGEGGEIRVWMTDKIRRHMPAYTTRDAWMSIHEPVVLRSLDVVVMQQRKKRGQRTEYIVLVEDVRCIILRLPNEASDVRGVGGVSGGPE